MLKDIKYNRIYNEFNQLIYNTCKNNTIVYGSRIDIEIDGSLYVLCRYDNTINRLVLFDDIIIKHHKDFGFGLSITDIREIIKRNYCEFFKIDNIKILE